MFENIVRVLNHVIRVIILRSYSWKSRKIIYLGKPAIQWRDPSTNVWVCERAAMRLLTVQVTDSYQRR